jgi:hypothetical protein
MKKLYFLITMICISIFAKAQLSLVSFLPSTVSPGEYVAVLQAPGPYYFGIYEYDSLTNYIDAIANGAVVFTAFSGTEYVYDPINYTFTVDFLPANTQFLNFVDFDDLIFDQVSLVTPLSANNHFLKVVSTSAGNSIEWKKNQLANIAKTELQYGQNPFDFQTIFNNSLNEEGTYLDFSFASNSQFYVMKYTLLNGQIIYSNTVKANNNKPCTNVKMNRTLVYQGTNLEIISNCTSQYAISNINGQILLRGNLQVNQNDINIQTLQVGSYFITFSNNVFSETTRFVVR